MKTKIIKQFQEMEIEVGDEIRESDRARIRAAVAGDTPAKIDQFFPAWYAVTNDRGGCGVAKIIRTK